MWLFHFCLMCTRVYLNMMRKWNSEEIFYRKGVEVWNLDRVIYIYLAMCNL